MILNPLIESIRLSLIERSCFFLLSSFELKFLGATIGGGDLWLKLLFFSCTWLPAALATLEGKNVVMVVDGVVGTINNGCCCCRGNGCGGACGIKYVSLFVCLL